MSNNTEKSFIQLPKDAFLHFVFSTLPNKKDGSPMDVLFCSSRIERKDGKINICDKFSKESTRSAKNAYKDGTDQYISSNSYKMGSRSRGVTNALLMHAVVIDIDAHDTDDPVALADAFIRFLCYGDGEDSAEHYNVPKPSVIVHTGRGVQVWYPLEPAYILLSHVRKGIAKKLCKQFQEIINDHPVMFGGMEADVTASTREDGLFRMPGSFNTHTGTTTYAILMSDKRWDINELKDACGAFVKPLNPSKQNTAPTKKSACKYGYKNTAEIRMDFIRRLIDSGELPHSRNELIFMFGVEAIQVYDAATVLDMLLTLNRRFSVSQRGPLRETEVHATWRSVCKHNYRYTDQAFCEHIGLSDTEAEAFFKAKKSKNSHKARDKRTKDAKKKMVETIRRLFVSGMNISEIARKLGKSRDTVRKYVKELKTCSKRNRKNQAEWRKLSVLCRVTLKTGGEFLADYTYFFSEKTAKKGARDRSRSIFQNFFRFSQQKQLGETAQRSQRSQHFGTVSFAMSKIDLNKICTT